MSTEQNQKAQEATQEAEIKAELVKEAANPAGKTIRMSDKVEVTFGKEAPKALKGKKRKIHPVTAKQFAAQGILTDASSKEVEALPVMITKKEPRKAK